MRITIEPFTPYDRSTRWRLHDAYFEARGVDAWQHGDVPERATSNYAIARQHARLLVELVDEAVASGRRAPDAPLTVLELGGGSGAFAAKLLRALDRDCGELGARLAGHVRYVFTDFAERVVREAAAAGPLAPWIEAGRVQPALYDLRRPDELRSLAGEALAWPSTPFDAVLANYVCCVAPTKQLQRHDGTWHELFMALHARVDDAATADPEALLDAWLAEPTQRNLMHRLASETAWRATGLDAVFDDPIHRRIVERLAGARGDATVIYPWGYVDALRALAPRLAPHGALWTNDFGHAGAEARRRLAELRPEILGNSLNHDVDFGLFDAVGEELGWGTLRTRDRVASVHTALLRPGGSFPDPVADRFEALYVHAHDGEELLDLAAAAVDARKQGEWKRAIRLWRLCLPLDPYDPFLRHQLGKACVDGGFFELALEPLEQALELRRTPGRPEVELQLARAHDHLGQPAKAIRYYERSLEHRPDAAILARIAALHLHRDELDDADHALRRALELDPSHQGSHELRRRLREAWRPWPIASNGDVAPEPLGGPFTAGS